jgi:hypothetical protein
MAVYRVTFTKTVTYKKSIEVRAHGKNEAKEKAKERVETRRNWEVNEIENGLTTCEKVEE